MIDKHSDPIRPDDISRGMFFLIRIVVLRIMLARALEHTNKILNAAGVLTRRNSGEGRSTMTTLTQFIRTTLVGDLFSWYRLSC